MNALDAFAFKQTEKLVHNVLFSFQMSFSAYYMTIIALVCNLTVR